APLAAPTLFWPGPTLAEALRDMNKPSSNLIAQQVLLSMARAAGVPAPSPETAAAWLQAWLDAHAGTAPPTRVVNGSGLAFVSPALLDGTWMVRISIGAEATERTDVAALWDLLQRVVKNNL
ncbi:MAG: hypothetical protein JNL44_15955, partial [Gemmatimonadetes bacterium]|nr:hypothetical protein [Gemmatimonadota bacterium]